MAAKIGGILLDLVAQTAKFQADIQKSTKAVADLGKQTKSAFSAIKTAVAGLIAYVGVRELARQFEETAKNMEKIGRMSDRLGIATEQLSALRFAAEQSGVSFDELASIVGKLQKRLGDGIRGTGDDAARALRELGVDAYDAGNKSRPIVELLPRIAAAMQGIQSEAEQLSLADALFGREGGAKFIDMLKDAGNWTENLTVATERARRLGEIFTKEQTQAARTMNDAIERIGFAWEGLKAKIVTAAAPTLERWADRLASFLAAVPRMLGAITLSLARAFDVSSAGSGEREKWDRFFSALGNIAIEGLAAVFSAIGIVASSLTDSVLDRVWKSIENWFGTLGERIGHSIAIAYNKAGMTFDQWIVDHLPSSGLLGAGAAKDLVTLKERVAQSEADLARLNVGVRLAAGVETAPGVDKAQTTLRQSLDAPQVRAWFTGLGDKLRGAMNTDAFSGATVEFLDAADAISGYRDALASTSMQVDESTPKIRELRKELDALAGGGDRRGAFERGWDQFRSGWSKAFRELTDRANDLRQLGFDLLSGSVNTFADSIAAAGTEAIFAGKSLSDVWKSTARAVGEAISAMLLKFAAMRIAMGIIGGVGSLFGGTAAAAGSSAASSGINFSGATADTSWAGISSPQFHADGTILTSPTMVAPGHVGGERGAELLAPVYRMPSGKMGVESVGGGMVVQIVDQRQSGDRPEVSRMSGPDGRQILRILIRDEVGRQINDGQLDRTLGASFGIKRVGVR